jgi:hypothetical protein
MKYFVVFAILLFSIVFTSFALYAEPYNATGIFCLLVSVGVGIFIAIKKPF